jgi:transcriptional regulator of acetoin/glycerol metabolism
MGESTDTQAGTESSVRIDAPRPRSQPQLFILLERGRPLAGGARHSLANIDEVALGRGKERGARRVVENGRRVLHLQVPDARMSLAHARLECRSGDWTISDCGSKNGTRVNDDGVDRALLANGDIVEVGQTLLRFRRAVPAPPNAPGDVEGSDLRGFSLCVGTLAPGMTRDLESLERIARSDVSILLEGETGTGKELLARAIHAASGRTGAFVAVNCGALPQGLAESLLFGHKKGAFSGATSNEIGFARAAHGGTLFLDEIGDLPVGSQAVLLRLLQEREVVPLGATHPVALDVRVVAATHRCLADLILAGAFRQDLLARLAQFTYALPPLWERVDDIGVLVAAILAKVGGPDAASLSIGARAARELVTYRWPANIRELEQRLKVAVVLATEGRIEQIVPEASTQATEAMAAPAARAQRLSPEDAALREQLLAWMAEHRGNLTQVAKAMATSRRQVQRWIARLQIDPHAFRA